MTHKIKYFAITLMLLITLSFAFEQQAHAYVDPGSGLLIFQGISAVVSGALIYFRRRIKGLFTKSRPTTAPSAIQPPAVTDHR
jgi:Skp family chaperone for outer membrane proteins